MLETLCKSIHVTADTQRGRIPYGYMKEYAAAQKGKFLVDVSDLSDTYAEKATGQKDRQLRGTAIIKKRRKMNNIMNLGDLFTSLN